jgi:SAM-dependent methyltransferase
MTMLPFTGHNILLPDGTQTCPGTPLIAGNGITLAALRMLSLCFPDGPEGVRVADLGCLEGGYAAAFAAIGYDVLGVEARKANFDRCQYVAGQLAFPNLRFALGDARNFEACDVDAVFCAGLLYHLDEPDTFLRMLGTVTRRLVILQTHFSTRPDAVHEGRRGHWQPDNPGGSDPWGSHRNTRSFWLARTDLLAAIRDAGFNVVITQHDYLDDITAGPQGIPAPPNPCGGEDRGMFAGVKT